MSAVTWPAELALNLLAHEPPGTGVKISAASATIPGLLVRCQEQHAITLSRESQYGEDLPAHPELNASKMTAFHRLPKFQGHPSKIRCRHECQVSLTCGYRLHCCLRKPGFYATLAGFPCLCWRKQQISGHAVRRGATGKNRIGFSPCCRLFFSGYSRKTRARPKRFLTHVFRRNRLCWRLRSATR